MSRSPTKRPTAAPGTSGHASYHVIAQDGGWQLRSAAGKRTAKVFSSRAEAEKAAQALVRDCGGAVIVHGPDGRVCERFTVGREAFAGISAVEGIQ
jgi:hypothetical protein